MKTAGVENLLEIREHFISGCGKMLWLSLLPAILEDLGAVPQPDLDAEIVETFFVSFSSSDKGKETTLFRVVPKKKRLKMMFISCCFCLEMTRHDQKRTNQGLKVGVGVKSWMVAGR